MEHLSRRVSHGIDFLIIVSDGSPTALRSAGRIAGIADDLELKIGRRCLVLTNLRGELPDRAAAELEKTGLEVVGKIPFDEEVAELRLSDRPISDLSPGAAALVKVSEMLDELLQKEEAA